MAISATGGTTSTITVDGTTYTVHKFTSTGSTNFVVTGSGTIEYLIVGGGGGGGGGRGGGGGGAGGLITGSLSVSANTYTIVVGSGGAAGTSSSGNGTSGGNSSAFGLTADGGGGGGFGQDGNTGLNGGSGGGGGGRNNSGGTSGLGGTGVSGQGSAGGRGYDPRDGGGGGGGGATGTGGAGTATVGGSRGDGYTSSFDGTSRLYAQGGAGGGRRGEGGGQGGCNNTTITGSAGTAGSANTGGGGGGGAGGVSVSSGGAGGSGIVILRYNPEEVVASGPDAPTITSVTSGNAQLSVAFTLAETGAAATNIEYSTNNGSTWTARSPASTTSPLVITGLTNGTTYSVKIRASNDAGSSTASNMVSGTPFAVPSAPTILAVSGGNAQLAVLFTVGTGPPTNIEYSVDNGSTWTARSPASTSNPFTITGLANEVTYQVKLRAVNAAGTSDASNMVEGTTVGTPGAPTITSVTRGNTQLTVAFTLGSGTPTNIQYSTNNGSTWTTRSPESTTSPLVITGLTNGTTYQIKLRASNTSGNSAASNMEEGTPSTAPGAPTAVTGFAGNAEVFLSWTAGSDGGASITDYVIQFTSDGGTTWTTFADGTSSSTSATVTGLTNSTAYLFRVAATNIAGTGSWSAPSTPVTPLAPEEPGSGEDPEPTDVTITGQFGIFGQAEFFPDPTIEGRFGISSRHRRTIRSTEPIDGVTPLPIIIDDDIEPPFAPTPGHPSPSPQAQIIDKAWYRTPLRRTVIVDMDGIPQDNGFLSTATHGDITWTRSDLSQWQVSIPVNSPEAQRFLADSSETGVTKAFKELQLWRGDKLLVWGPVIGMAVNGATLQLTGSDPAWYLSRRSVGPAGPLNLMPYPAVTPNLYGWFQSVFKGWTNPDVTNEPDLNIGAARLPRSASQWAIRIEDRRPIYANDPEWDDAVTFPTAMQIITLPSLKVRTAIEFSCFIHIEEFISRNDESSSIGIALFPDGARDLQDLIDVQWAQVGDDFPVGVRQRLKVSMEIPASQRTFATLMVRGPKGVSYLWDFDLQWDGGLINIGMDKADIMIKLVDHLSGNPATIYSDARQHPLRPFLGPTTYGKTNVKIGTSIRKSGYYLDRVYSFDNSSGGLNLITDLAEDDEASGWKMIYSHSKRWFFRMRNESVRWDCRVWFNENGGNIIGKPSWQFLGEQGANVVKVTSSQGSSAIGVPVSALNPSSPVYTNDPVWDVSIEEISQAPQDFPDEWLTQYAQDRLWATTRPVSLSLTVSARPHFTENNLQVGESIPVSIRYGNLKIAGLYRIHQMTLTADDHLQLVLTPSNRKGVQLT